MEVDPVSGSAVGTGDAALTDAVDSQLGKDEFLKLLMAQLENQDPMNPLKNHEFVAQLATFSTLEQQVLANDRLQELQLAQLSQSNVALASFIGQDISARGDAITISGNGVDPVGIQLDDAAASVTVTIKDASGKIVHTTERTDLGAGPHQISWPGTDQNNNPLPAGEYAVEVEALDAAGEPVGASAVVEGTVTGISFDNGYPELLVGDLRVQPADILSVGESTGDPVRTPPG